MIHQGCLQVDLKDRWVLDEIHLVGGMKVAIELGGRWITGRLEEEGQDLSYCSEREPTPTKLFTGLKVRLI